jgi:YebC/PmpR family DNA-binding regulatory protein
MAGHSHWAGIKHKKALIDAKRGKQWSKLSKAIIVAAKMGGGDPDANNRLRLAIDAAKAVSMPKDNIQRAIKRGTGEIEGASFEEVLYEGYGPGGVAILCEILTDNRNRTAAEIRKIFDISDGKLGGAGRSPWRPAPMTSARSRASSRSPAPPRPTPPFRPRWPRPASSPR